MTDWKKCADELQNYLRLKTLPLGIKFFETEEAMKAVEKVRVLSNKATFCAWTTMARTTGMTLGLTKNNLAFPECLFHLGLAPLPEEGVLDGQASKGIWMETQEDAGKFQSALNAIRLPFGKYTGLILAPINSGRLDPPDAISIWGNPAQVHHILNGLQWKDYERLSFFFTGEGSCGDSFIECLKTNRPAVSIPCFGQRRYGHVQDDEMEVAIPPSHLEKLLEGLRGIRKAGARYPIPFFGMECNPVESVSRVYPPIKKYIEAIDRGEFPKSLSEFK